MYEVFFVGVKCLVVFLKFYFLKLDFKVIFLFNRCLKEVFKFLIIEEIWYIDVLIKKY